MLEFTGQHTAGKSATQSKNSRGMKMSQLSTDEYRVRQLLEARERATQKKQRIQSHSSP